VRFTSPETVISPKANVSNVRVLLNTGEAGWALAAMLWDSKEALGIRWNGHPENPIGNPQSRGIPTWFVLPDEVAIILRGRFGDSLGDLNDQNADITRVKVRPLPNRIWKGEPQEQIDDVWVLSITDRSQGSMQIMNPRTGHFLALHRSHIKTLVRDPTSDAPNGPKHGLLELTVQVVFEDSKLRLEPLQTLNDRIDELFSALWDTGYENKHERVRALIQETRTALAGSSGELGQWETRELNYAETAVRSNFLRLALTAITKAIAVSKLSRDEYDFGLNYGHAPATSDKHKQTGINKS
jgi:hypothetical protein